MFEENKLVSGYDGAAGLMQKVVGVPIKVLAGFADWIGMGDTVRKIYKGGSQALDEDEAQRVVRSLVTKALASKDVDISKLQDRLNALPLSVPPDLRSQIANYKQSINNKINNAQFERAAIETAGLKAESLARDAEKTSDMASQTTKLQEVEKTLTDAGIK